MIFWENLINRFTIDKRSCDAVVIVRLSGGIGNQMFQYSTARSFAYHKKAQLKADITAYSNTSKDTKRKFVVNILNTNITIAEKKDIAVFISPDNLKEKLIHLLINADTNTTIGKILYKLGATMTNYIIIRQPHFNYYNIFEHKKKHTYLVGDWQSEKYFKSIERIIRKEFKLKLRYEDTRQDIIKLIISQQSVSIHVRRGDYKNKTNSAIYYSCLIDYYTNALNIIKEKYPDISVFVFSDDISWTKKKLKPQSPVLFIEKHKINEAYDLLLMSKCKHNIIANSTFSWWAAWLNSNPEKIVIAPDKWFKNDKINTDDLYPEGWIKI